MDRKTTLEQAISIVCQDREAQYGSPEDNFEVISALWSYYLGCDIEPHDVAMLMALLKIARIKSGRYKDDNYIDLAGYAACAAEIVDRCMPVAKEEDDT